MKYLSQEIEAWYIIPAVRRDIAKCLVLDHGVSYGEVGELLSISKAAISQYFKGKRAAKIKLPDGIGPKIMSSCKALKSGKSNSTDEINKLLDHIKKKKLSCSVCGKVKEGVFDDCLEVRFDGKNYY